MANGSVQTVEEIEAEAAVWAAKLDAAPSQDHPELDAWFAQNPRHVGALLRAQAMLAAFTPPVEDLDILDDRTETGEQQTKPWGRMTFFGGAAGVAIAIAASIAAFLLIAPAKETYETEIGEVRALALSDGSTVAIDAKSRIEVSYDKSNRDIRLDAGKVFFRAVHAEKRPFRVILGNVVVTDIGTAFQVDRNDAAQAVDVLVTEGAVWVDAPSGRKKLIAGQYARFSQSSPGSGGKTTLEPVRKVDQADMDRTLAWRQGQLELNGESLDTAVAEFNRHSRVQLRVGDQALGRESLYGSFRFDDASGFARTIAAGLGVDAKTGDGVIVIGPEKK